MSRLIALLLLAVVALPAQAAPPATRIVASINPLAMVVTAVAPPGTRVEVLVPASATTHDYQLTPGDLQAINEADLVVWAGPEAEPYLAPVLDKARADQRVVTLSKLPGVVLRDLKLDSADTKKSARDPHLWLSTRNAAVLGRAVGARLGNTLAADHFVAEMQRYRNRQAKRFAAIAPMPLYVAHDAYGYLLDELGLTNVSALVTDPAVPPSARRVADLAQRAKDEQVGCMIGEPGFRAGVAPRLFEGLRANLVEIDPQLGSVAMNRDSYTLAMTHLADTLYNCMVTR